METKIADTRKSTNLLKSYLKNKFGIDFKVKTEKYSGGSSINISYMLGPDDHLVSMETAQCQHGSFNGMEDIYEYTHPADFILEGFKLETFNYVFVSQDVPTEFWFEIGKLFSKKFKFQDVPELKTMEQMNENFKERFGSAWTWLQLLRQSFEVLSFVTDDPSKITLIDITRDKERVNSYVITYSVEGIEYKTTSFPERKTDEKSKDVTATFEDISIVDYSDKAIAVIGETKPIKEILGVELQGRFNRFLKVNDQTVAGWIFPKTRAEQVKQRLAQL
jgi:hypothetical protein